MTGIDRITSESEFVEIYGEVEVGQPPMVMPLRQALQLEAILCPAPEDQRRDPAKRLQKLAEMVGARLLEEHTYLLPKSQ